MIGFRRHTHDVFDQLWLYGYMTRDEAYDWLAKTLKIPRDQAHVSRLTKTQCAKLRSAVARYMRTADDRAAMVDSAMRRSVRRVRRSGGEADKWNTQKKRWQRDPLAS